MTGSSKISKQHDVQGSSTTSTLFKSRRDPLYLLKSSRNLEGE